MNEQRTTNNRSGIKSVSYYIACPVETCDRCSQAIKRVAVITYKDGFSEKVGCDCVERILSGDNSLISLFRKNVKLLAKLKSYVEILSRPVDQIPVDERGYYNRGFYFIADAEGKAMCYEKYCFHPTRLDEKAIETFDGKPTFWWKAKYHPNTVEMWQQKCNEDMQEMRDKLSARVAQIEAFLARVVAKGMATAPASEVTR